MRQYRFGIVSVHTNIDYPRSLFLGVQNTVEGAGHTLVAVSDLIPYHTLTNADAYMRVATEVVSRLDLDAIIFPVGCVTAFLRGDNGKALELLDILDPAKTLVMDRELEGYRCVNKDGIPGMRECMRHLIETCGFTQIAFVSGPKKSRGARERETVYFEEMAAHGLPVPPQLFVRGDFGGDCADVIEKLLDDNPQLQAIACACDLIAYTAYSVLRKRKLVAGADIAITGFDDHPRSSHMDPPLSTVHLTAYDFGCMAGREALRMCEGLPQEERVLNSRFVARGSCGEGVRNDLERFRVLLRQKPFPADTFVSIMLDSTISMAPPRVLRDFRSQMDAFMSKVHTAYLRHRAAPSEDDLLFSSHDLAALFGQGYREDLSLEGFHTVAITMLEALLEESPEEDANWVIEQMSYLHLRIARLLSDAVQANNLAKDRREWISFHMIDDALREDGDPTKAYELILGEFQKLGVVQAHLFLLPETVCFVGARAFALSDAVRPLGRVSSGAITVEPNAEPIVLQRALDHALGSKHDVHACTVAGLMAGNELLGVAVIEPGDLSINAQVMAFLNMGAALKHLQMLATEREMNQLLATNNLLLEHQSQHDELTGLLNRRGFSNRLARSLSDCVGADAAVLYLDLDGLKSINDTYGHDVGDEAICATARILRTCVPDDGLLSRLGGDEFAAFVLMDAARVEELLSHVQQAMETYNATHDVPYTLAISAGSSVFTIDEHTSDRMAELMAQADARLYEMKRRRKRAALNSASS